MTIESDAVSASIIVLAAGRSTRMGRPKALMPFDGQTCLSLVLNACLGSSADQTILVLGADATALRDEAEARAGEHIPARLTSVVNDRHDRGQTSTVKAGLEASSPSSDGFVLFPVDHPLVTSADIDALIARHEARPRGRTIFVATCDNMRGHPLLLSAAHRAAILELEDDEPIHNYVRLREGETEQVPTENPGVVSGMNTPAEYERLLALYRSGAARREGRTS
jgi:molybdenum cofactor cytidylyltransferase